MTMGLELAEVVMGIEEALGLRFLEEAPLAWNHATIGDLIDFTVALHIRQRSTQRDARLTSAEIATLVIAVVGAVTCRRPEEVRREHRLVDIL